MTPPGERAEPTTLAGTWVGDELQRTLAQVGDLQRQLAEVQASLKLQQDEVARLQERLQTVDGRTQRHEAVGDLAREVRHEVAALEEELRSEASLRRDLAAHVERSERREHEGYDALRKALESIARRVERYEGEQAASAERQRHLGIDIAEHSREDQDVLGRLDALERRVAAELDGSRSLGEEVSRVGSKLPDLVSGLDELRSRVAAMHIDQRRLDDDVAALRSVRDREDALLDVLEQQRATRTRVEDRMNSVDETVEEMRRALEAAEEERALLGRGQAGLETRMRALGERLEAQRLTVLEHLRRQVLADEETGRRRREEIEREARVARDLLVRLIEQSGEIEQEPPP